MFKRVTIFLIKAALVIALLFGLFFGSVHLGLFGHIYTKRELGEFRNHSASLVLSDNGSLIGKFFFENRTNISFEQLPQELIDALIATEDARYFEHEGIDSRSLLRVLIKSILLRQKGSGGGSTITQQLAKNMFGRDNYGFMSLPVNKTKEMILASRIEEMYSKEEILRLYLNTVPFGENVYGVEAASLRFFNKKSSALRLEEAAVLVGMLKANTYYNPRLHPKNALIRRNVVLEQMKKYGYLSQEASDSIQQIPLRLNYANLESGGPADYFLVEVRRQAERILKGINEKKGTTYDLNTSGLRVETTLSLELQQYAARAIREHLTPMQARLDLLYRSGNSRRSLDQLVREVLEREGWKDRGKEIEPREMFSWKGFTTDSISLRDSISQALSTLQAGFLAVDANDGEVKAWIGGNDHRTQPYDQVYAKRQTASAFKPILYASALEQGAMPCQYLDNDPFVLKDFENWRPQNYDHSSGGKYSVSAALARSMNIPSVNLFFWQDFRVLESIWSALGFSEELESDPSTALGTTSASLYEMTRAYGAFANGGRLVEPVIIRSIKSSDGTVLYRHSYAVVQDQVLSAQSAELLNRMLVKAVNEGTGRSMRSTYGVGLPLAGKTGTSQGYADAWFIGYSENLVLSTRIGAPYPSVHFNKGSEGSGAALALPVVARTLQRVERSTGLTKRFFGPFQFSQEDPVLACQDYIEESELDLIFDRFVPDQQLTYEKATRKARRGSKKKKKKGFFRRLFGKD